MFREVPPNQIHQVWGFVEPGLSAIKRRCKANWLEREIRIHLQEGRASLFVHPNGFVIVEKCSEPITRLPYLNAWLGWSKAGEAKKHLKGFVQWMDEMRSFTGCDWWQLGSPRDGWNKLLEPYCEKALTIWRRK